MKINKLPQISQVILFWKLIGSFTTLRAQLKKKKKKKKKKKNKKKKKKKQNKTKFCT
jgi:outer membrane receptor for monomeric catechols